MPVLPVLERSHDVIALDLPGFGDSPPLPPGTSVHGPVARRCGRGRARRGGCRRSARGRQLARRLGRAGARAARPGAFGRGPVAGRHVDPARDRLRAPEPGPAAKPGVDAAATVGGGARPHRRRTNVPPGGRHEPPLAAGSGRGGSAGQGGDRFAGLEADARLDVDAPSRGPRGDPLPGADRLGQPRHAAPPPAGTPLPSPHPPRGAPPAPRRLVTCRCGTTPSS